MSLPASTLDKLMRLAALTLAPDERALLESDLDKIVALIDAMQAIDTSAVEALAHPLDGTQPLRPDAVTETVDRELLQRGAPKAQDGLYLVPRVVD